MSPPRRKKTAFEKRFPGCCTYVCGTICLAKLHLLSHCTHSGDISKHSCFSDLFRMSSWHSSGPSNSSFLLRPLLKCQLRLDYIVKRSLIRLFLKSAHLFMSIMQCCFVCVRHWLCASANISGVIINTCGWVHGKGYQCIVQTAGAFEGIWHTDCF